MSITKHLDSLTLWYVRRRVKGEPLRKGNHFGDRLTAVLQAELDSRIDELARMKAQQQAREIAEAERVRIALAAEEFSQVSSPVDRARLQ
jgi:hypothetical protein